MNYNNCFSIFYGHLNVQSTLLMNKLADNNLHTLVVNEREHHHHYATDNANSSCC